EADAFVILSWVKTFSSDAVLTSSLLYHYNRANLDGGADDFPVSTTDHRSSSYEGGQENLRLHFERNDLRVGVMGFAQQDRHTFDVLFNEGSSPNVHQALRPSGSLIAAYLQDTFEVTDWAKLTAGIRQTHFAGAIVENATNPRVGVTFRIPRLNWVLRAF